MRLYELSLIPRRQINTRRTLPDQRILSATNTHDTFREEQAISICISIHIIMTTLFDLDAALMAAIDFTYTTSSPGVKSGAPLLVRFEQRDYRNLLVQNDEPEMDNDLKVSHS